jgi:anaerobic selenocysteine-containing dehydrogenase
MAQADLIVVWGANPVSTQVNMMHHIQRARRQRGAKLVGVDGYRTPSIEATDIGIVVRPGTAAALACAMMAVMLEEGMADRDYLAHYTDFDDEVECHLNQRTPAWAAEITGLSEQTSIDVAPLYGRTSRAFLRLGFGFTRSRNGSANMHAVSALPAVSGAWRHRGGDAFFLNLDNWRLDTTLAHGLDAVDDSIRLLDQSRIGPILCGDRDALSGGPPVTAMLMQNANSATVAPDRHAVRRGLTRDVQTQRGHLSKTNRVIQRGRRIRLIGAAAKCVVEPQGLGHQRCVFAHVLAVGSARRRADRLRWETDCGMIASHRSSPSPRRVKKLKRPIFYWVV